MASKQWTVALLALTLSACAGGFGSNGLQLTPERLTILEGDTVTLDLSASAGAGEWRSGDTTVVRVVEPGRIVAVAPGRALVTVSSGGRQARAYVYVDRAILVGAGDIGVCGYEADEATARLLDDISGTIWTTGDNAYPSGTEENFQECFDPTWGRHKDRIRPTPGNHEYRSPGAEPYFEYFGDAAGEAGKGWYSYRYGGWLVIALNSNITDLGPAKAAEQLAWLERVLAEEEAQCTVAYLHHPLVSSGSHGPNLDDALDDENVKPFWERLYAAGADVILAGHDHHYERFAPLDPDANLDRERGIRQFIVGTGGGALRGTGDEIHPHSRVFDNNNHGVLELVLRPDGYEWQFVSITGQGVDSGRARCH